MTSVTIRDFTPVEARYLLDLLAVDDGENTPAGVDIVALRRLLGCPA